jgi:DNA-directed RNA polymerase subunit M/transcription elongation factor TFIIS
LWIKRVRSDFQISEIELSNILDLVNSSQKSFKDNYFSLIYPFKIKNIDSNINCKNCFQKEKFQEKFVLNNNAQKDIENFIEEYLKNKKITARQSWLNEKSFNSKIEEYKKNMNWKLRVKLNDKIKSSNLVNKQEMNFFYESKINPLIEKQANNGIQDINYSFEVAEYKLEQIKQIVENVYFDYYKNNSLKTGAKPYSYCYGNNPYCSPPNGYKECSFIDFKGPSNSDVIVIIKKNDRVYSHVYIKAGGYYKFKLGNGNFQSFFYYGKGWNPTKYIKTANCGRILGGFIKSEFVDKSEIINLYHSSMSYTLYSVTNGNFVPKSSNKNEAF